MSLLTRRSLLLAGAALLTPWQKLFAGHGHCSHCRCQSSCRKVCRLVCEEKKVEVICLGGKCEDFCLPGPSKRGCRHCEELCATCPSCAKDGVVAGPKKFVWYEWIPGCAKLHTKNKLMKKVETKKIPSYKWVVEDLCGRCEGNCLGAAVPADAEIPPPPLTDVPLKFVRLDSPSTSVE